MSPFDRLESGLPSRIKVVRRPPSRGVRPGSRRAFPDPKRRETVGITDLRRSAGLGIVRTDRRQRCNERSSSVGNATGRRSFESEPFVYTYPSSSDSTTGVVVRSVSPIPTRCRGSSPSARGSSGRCRFGLLFGVKHLVTADHVGVHPRSRDVLVDPTDHVSACTSGCVRGALPRG